MRIGIGLGFTTAVSGATEPLSASATATTGDWFEYELYDVTAGTSFTLDVGALPAGLSFMADVGIIHGAPTTPGETTLEFLANGTQRVVLTLTVEQGGGFDAVQGGAIRRMTTLGISAPASPTLATYAIAFNIPVAHATDVMLTQGTTAYHIRVLGSNGRIRFEAWDVNGTTKLADLTSDAGAGDFRTGTEHTLIISFNGTTPECLCWVDGVAVTWNNAVTAGSPRIETGFYSVAANTSGTLLPIPVGGWVRWSYVEFGAARVPADFDPLNPVAAGTPQLFFGGSLADWQNGVNGGSTEDWTVQHGTWVVVEAGAGAGDPTPLAFEGAVGFGRYTTGGRGKPVYRVTNTSASAAVSGSLPWAIAQSVITTGGYILIEAEGPVELSDYLSVDAPNVTIDARRQPGLGLWLSGGALWIEESNVLLRHVRCYAGSNFVGQNPTARDSLIVATRTEGVAQENIYLDRCDAMFSIDEAFSIFPWRAGSSTSNVTVHGMLAAEPCHQNLHVDEGSGVDDHAKAVLIGALVSDVTFYGCLFASADDRMPRALGQAQEFINCVTANYGSTGIQVHSTATADFINSVFMLGDRPGNPTSTSSKWIQGTTSTTLEAVYESGCFTGAWTLAGGFNDAAMIDNWRNQTSSSTFMQSTALDNPALFTKSGAAAGAMSYSEAFLSISDRIGSLNVHGERHPFAERVVGYITEAVPFSTGWHGTPYGDNMPPDELRAQGATVTVPGAGALTVTLPAAPAAATGRAWTGVQVTVLNAYTNTVNLGATSLPRNANGWGDGVTLSGSLAGGAVAFTGLPAGFYTARVTYEASGIPMTLYMGRPVAVG